MKVKLKSSRHRQNGWPSPLLFLVTKTLQPLQLCSTTSIAILVLVLSPLFLFTCVHHVEGAKIRFQTLRSGFRNERLLELYETHQKLCRVNDTQEGQGVCIFMWDCHRSGGTHLGLCSIDAAIYGSCCSVVVQEEQQQQHPTDPPPPSTQSAAEGEGAEGVHEDLNAIPVDEGNKPTRPITTDPASGSVSTSSTAEVPVSNSPDIEFVTEYSEEDESQSNLGAEVSPYNGSSSSSQNQAEQPQATAVPVINQPSCGIPARPFTSSMKKMRIIGGMDSQFASWPWVVSVRRSSLFGYSSTHSCGGVLINENWIVTAAHCVFALSKSLIRVRLGDFDFKEENEELPFIERPIERRVIHPEYNFTSYENDLALLQLQKPIEYTLHISPICLPLSMNESFVGENGTIMGWGRLSEGGRYATKLQQVVVPILSNQNCMELFKESGRIENIPENFICAGYRKGGKDGCQGDSGGPLQILSPHEHKWILAGVMSWGVGCGEPNSPGVYTRISKFAEWILQQITTE